MNLNTTQNPLLTNRFEQALVYASRLHRKQIRKGSNIPYISHLLSVAALVLEDGGDEDEAIAALLHDAVEDQGGEATREVIFDMFGAKVIQIVDGCTDADTIPKPSWQKRKQQYIDNLRSADASIRRVSLADKLHNARSILRDLSKNGESTWGKFKGGKEGTLWYYQTVLELFLETEADSCMVKELKQIVKQFSVNNEQ